MYTTLQTQQYTPRGVIPEVYNPMGLPKDENGIPNTQLPKMTVYNPIMPPYTAKTRPQQTFIPIIKDGKLDNILMFSPDDDNKSEPNIVEKVVGTIIGVIANEALKH